VAINQLNLEKLDITAAVASASVTATATSGAIDLKEFDGDVLLVLNCAAGTGSSPTLDIKVQDSDETGGTYGDLSGATFTQVTDSASVQTLEVNKDECKRFIKIVQTVGGSSPVFVYGISLVGAKKYG
tara:strand:- start:15304 stop:15687 length:384 start_codon:yes stop_codon:yes gene_type:complete